jgi:phosphatidylserine decarboxylase
MYEILFKSECLTRYTLSRLLKRVHERKIHQFILTPIISSFEKIYRVDSNEFEQREFESFSDYFTRELKNIKEQRPTGSGLVSPVDASNLKVQDFELRSDVHVKATKTTLHNFTGFDLNNSDYFGIHFYLSPKNYHRIHCPFKSVTIEDAKYIAGHRLMIEKLDASFLTQNERACFKLKTEDDLSFYLVLTGAFCVGNIYFSPLKKLLNQNNISDVIGTKFTLLEEVARFAFGSSSSLILPKQHFSPADSIYKKHQINLGESLGSLCPKHSTTGSIE